MSIRNQISLQFDILKCCQERAGSESGNGEESCTELALLILKSDECDEKPQCIQLKFLPFSSIPIPLCVVVATARSLRVLLLSKRRYVEYTFILSSFGIA
jgi:hypothetical protein